MNVGVVQITTSKPSRAPLRTILWTSGKKTSFRPHQGGQGRRSRGGHEWPPCLEGPEISGDTMDEAGSSEPAWMRLVSQP